MRVIPDSRLVVKPVDTAIFEPYVRNNPARSVLLEDLDCTVFQGLATLNLDGLVMPSQFEARILDAQVVMDSYFGSNTLSILLDCPTLVKLHDAINVNNQSAYIGNYVPAIVLQYNVHAGHSKYRWFYTEVMETFSTRLAGTSVILGAPYVISTGGLTSVSDSPNSDPGGSIVTLRK